MTARVLFSLMFICAFLGAGRISFADVLAAPPPAFSISPSHLDFGSVNTGSVKVDSVVVTNTGTTNLNIQSITIDSAEFTITPGFATIAASSSRTFYITFAPIYPGSNLAHIVFRHNAATVRDTITAQGTGVGPAYIPVFSISPVSIHFGDVTNGSTKTEDVVITNTGTAPLRITNVASSLTVFSGSPKVDTIAPAASGTFTITFAPLIAGSYSGKIHFLHNAPGGRDSIAVDGTGTGPNAEPHFTVAPTSLDFGDVATGTSKTDSVTVTNTGLAPLTISNTSSSSGRFTVTPRNATIAASASRQFYITFTPNAAGVVQATIMFPHNATGGRDSISVQANGTGDPLAPKFSISPTSLAFGTVQNGTTKADSVFVTNTGTANLTVSSVTSSNGSYTVTPAFATIAPTASRKFTITFAPTTDGDKNGFIRFQHNATPNRDSIPVSGTGTGGSLAPKFSIMPSSVAFGTVQNGTTKADSVFVTNTGTANLQITSTTSSNSSYTVSPNTATIAPSATRKFTITFAPMSDGDKDGFIRFQHNATPNRDSIAVSGTGTGGTVEPKFSVSPTSIAFGNVQNGTSKIDSVFVTNTGTANLVISSASSSSSYFTVAPAIANIPPAGSRKFTVTFSPLFDGAWNGFIRFQHNAAGARDSIPVSGTGEGGSVAPVFTASTRIVDFDTLSTGMSRTDSITVTNTGKSALNITNATSTNARFSVTPRIFTIEPNLSRTVYITFAPLLPGEDTARIVFTHNAAGSRDTLLALGQGVGTAIQAVFGVSARTLDFGNLGIGTTKKDSVTVTNTGNTTLTVTQTNITAPFTVTPRNASIAPNESREFVITFAPVTEGTYDGMLIFTHNGSPTRDTIRLHGIGDSGSEDPVFKAIPATLALGGVLVSAVKMDSISVRNTGRNVLTITSIAIDKPMFTIFPPTGNIGPSESKTFFVMFTPTDTSAVSAAIVFTDNAVTQHDTVRVTGRGLPLKSIQNARAAAVGTEVAFEGVVTRVKGTYLRMQDQDAGIAVRQTAGLLFDAIADGEIQMGDRIQVFGKVSDLQSLRILNGADVNGYKRVSRGNPLPAPVPLTLAQIAQDGEQYESRLVTVSGLTINGGADTAFRAAKTYLIHDISDTSNTVALRIAGATDTDVDGMPFFGVNVTFTGVLGQISVSNPARGYQLTPVLPTDLHSGASDISDHFQDSPSGIVLWSYPNPFSLSGSGATTISYRLPASMPVSVNVYSVLGTEVARFAQGFREAGTHLITWNGRDMRGVRLAGGTYIVEVHGVSPDGQRMIRSTGSIVIAP